MSFSSLVLAEPSLYEYYNCEEARGTGTFGPNFFSNNGTEALRYDDNETPASFQVSTPCGLGYQWLNPTNSPSAFEAFELDLTDNAFGITSPGSWTYEVVCQITDTVNRIMLMEVSDNNTRSGVSIIHDPTIGIQLWVDNVLKAAYANPSTTSFADGAFHHFVLVADEPSIKVYVDSFTGISISQSSGMDGVHGSQITMGFSYVLSESLATFSGILDELVIYNDPLTAADILTHYEAIFPSGAITNQLQVVADGYIQIEAVETNPLDLKMFRGGNPSIDFPGDGQFLFWRGGYSPVLDATSIYNKIDVLTDGYVFDPVPVKDVLCDGLVQVLRTTEIIGDGWVASNTSVVCDGLVVGTNKRLYPRDSNARTSLPNRFYPLEP